MLLSQSIGAVPPLTWLVERREQANYGSARFSEPRAPDHFAAVEREGVRRLVQAYTGDLRHAYTFDEDHAMLAYPIKVVGTLAEDLNRKGQSLDITEEAFLRSLCCDRKGPIEPLLKAFRG